MSDFMRMRNAVSLINQGNQDKAWAALHWVFCTTDLEPDGFFQTACRLGINAERYKTELLDRSRVARNFFYGNNTEEEGDDECEAC